jgi:hypothetical protein
MKKQLAKRPLVLETTTVRTLTAAQIGAVDGGRPIRTFTCLSTLPFCPTV